MVRGKVPSKRLQFTRNAEWVKVPILESLQRIICRATNRIFVGVPLCSSFSGSTITSAACVDIYFFPGRDYDYQTLNLSFAINVVKFGLIIGMFPEPLKPFVVLSIQLKVHIPFSLNPPL